MSADVRSRFFEFLRSAAGDGTLVKLTLGKSRSTDPTLKNVFIRPVTLKAGRHLTFVWRHATPAPVHPSPIAVRTALAAGFTALFARTRPLWIRSRSASSIQWKKRSAATCWSQEYRWTTDL